MRELLTICLLCSVAWPAIGAAQANSDAAQPQADVDAAQVDTLRDGCNRHDAAACRDLGTLYAVGSGVGREPLRAHP